MIKRIIGPIAILVCMIALSVFAIFLHDYVVGWGY